MKPIVRVMFIDLQRAFGSISFFLAVVGVAIIYYAGARSEINYAPDVLLLFKYSTEASGFHKLILLFCVLPYTISFCEDWNSNYIKAIVIRSGLRQYAISKMISCAFSAGISVWMGIALFIAPLMVNIPLVSTTAGNYEAFATQTLAGEWLLEGRYLLYFAVYIYLASLAGAFWAVVGLCASAFIPNKFVALFIPFIGFYILVFFTYEFPVWLQLSKIANGDIGIAGTFPSLLYATLLFAVLFFLVGLLFMKMVARRLSHD